MLFVTRQAFFYRGDEEGAGVLDPVGLGASRSPGAPVAGPAPSTSHEDRSQKTRAARPQLLTSRPDHRKLGDLEPRTNHITLQITFIHLAHGFI